MTAETPAATSAARSPRRSIPRALKGARIGLLRQRFVGVTGEREIATLMDAVAARDSRRRRDRRRRERAGHRGAATARAVRNEPGALKAAWNAYLRAALRPTAAQGC